MFTNSLYAIRTRSASEFSNSSMSMREMPTVSSRVGRSPTLNEALRSLPCSHYKVFALAAHGDHLDRRLGPLYGLTRRTLYVADQCSAQAAVRRDEQQRGPFNRSVIQERDIQFVILRSNCLYQVRKDGLNTLGIRPAGQDHLLGAAHLGRGDELHCLRDLRSIVDRPNAAAKFSGARHVLLLKPSSGGVSATQLRIPRLGRFRRHLV